MIVYGARCMIISLQVIRCHGVGRMLIWWCVDQVKVTVVTPKARYVGSKGVKNGRDGP